MNPTTSKLTLLLGTASLMTMANAMAAQAQQQTAQAAPMEVPEQVLITGSLIHGTAAVGVPVTNLSPQDFAQTGALTTADLFRTVPAANVSPGPVATQSGANIERATRVNLRGLDTGNAVRSLLLVDGILVPPQGNGQCEIDPSIIPALSLDRIDVLVDGASATYGSNAIGGVINIILKRGFDGAISQLRYTGAEGGKTRLLASQLWGRTWDGGDITLGYEWYDDHNIEGSAKNSKWRNDYSPWGLVNRVPLGSSMPGTLSAGNPATTYPGGLAANMGTACTNCFAIPAGNGTAFNPINGGLGPTAPFSASQLDWSTFNVAGNGGTNGTRNEFEPFSIAYFDAAQQRNAATMTIDQRLTKNISFYGEGFYSNRRAQFINPASISPANNNLITSFGVPTFNPYYPTGGAPTNLRVNYSIAIENPSITSAYEVADRYMGGFNIDLPGNWTGNIYYSQTYDSSFNRVSGTVNKNAVSAALGWTMAPTLAVGTTPGIATWTKPASVPYLNLFCDARTIQCNSQSTLNYVSGLRSFNEKFWSNEKGAKFDGPLFALPAGDVKAAVGSTYQSYHFDFTTFDNTSASTLILPLLNEPRTRSIWATFAQVNIPVFGDANALPGIRKFDVEVSWRHDQYSDVGGTSNPKVAFNWNLSEDIGLTIRGAWGTSFRAPFFGETSALANVAIQPWNVASNTSNDAITLNPAAEVGSAAYRLLHPTVGPTPSVNALLGGISMNGGSRASAGLRQFTAGGNTFDYNGGNGLQPEKAMNWAIGGEFAPTTFLQGLDIQATWYQTKITGALVNFGNPTSTGFSQGARGFAYILPTDLVAFDPTCNNNLTPSTCAPFEDMVRSLLANPRNIVVPSELTNIMWINDGGTFNKGDIKLSGIDWQASYDWDWADVGAFNAGIVGTYYLHNYITTVPGAAGLAGTPLDTFHTDLSNAAITQVGVESLPRMRYRARLGWSNGPWSVTGFMDYNSHYYHTQTAPPNVNNQCTSAGIPGGSLPCAISNYTNIQPPQYTFDLSMGYDTGDDPVNDYLKHIGIQVVIQNIMDKDPAFQYRTQAQGGNPAAYDILKSYQGRTISLIVTKTW